MERAVIRTRLAAALKTQNDDPTFISRRSLAETAFDEGDLEYCAKLLDMIGH